MIEVADSEASRCIELRENVCARVCVCARLRLCVCASACAWVSVVVPFGGAVVVAIFGSTVAALAAAYDGAASANDVGGAFGGVAGGCADADGPSAGVAGVAAGAASTVSGDAAAAPAGACSAWHEACGPVPGALANLALEVHMRGSRRCWPPDRRHCQQMGFALPRIPSWTGRRGRIGLRIARASVTPTTCVEDAIAS